MKLFILCLRFLIVAVGPLCLPGCVMQYQRQYLGDPIMQFNHDQEEKALKSHTYPRREGSSGGDGGAGGGCGC